MKKNKTLFTVFSFLFRFFSLYFLGVFFYQKYLNFYSSKQPIQVDPYTEMVSLHTSTVTNLLGYNSYTAQISGANYMGFYIDSKLDAYINEGCNAVSLMLIFVAFVFAFYNGFVKSLLFCLGSIVFLHFTNIGRITLLSLINYHHPTWSKFSHDVIFPLIIYGAIILLWIVWISLFIRSKKAA